MLSLVGSSIGCSDGAVRSFDLGSLENELKPLVVYQGEGCCLNHDENDETVLAVNDNGDLQVFAKQTG